MIDAQVAFDKLAQFEHPEELADFLFHGGYQGTRMNSAKCPIARYLQTTVGGPWYVSILQIGRVFEVKPDFRPTDTMASFLRNFDTGSYPYLVEA